MDPFLLFPEEIWEMILNHVEDSQDASNLFRAFPQLDMNSTLQKKKHLWLFGLVIPHLVPWKRINWINEKELLNCRMTCKRWSTHIDTFLDNQTQLKAYRPEDQKPGGTLFWNTKPYFEKIDVFEGYDWDGDDEGFECEPPRRVLHFGGTFIDYPQDDDGAKSPSKFLKDMESHPHGRSPFLSRSLSIRLPYSHGGREKVRKFWDDMIFIHHKFGGHVWNYDIDISVHRNDEEPLPQHISQCLSQLPNLRSLSISADDGYPEPTVEEIDELGASLENGLPPLPNLETLRIIRIPFATLGHPLMIRFSTQIRRLEISIWMWRNEYRQLFPNLTELQVAVRSSKQVTVLKDLLMTLEAPQLAKFQLNARTFNEDGYSVDFDCGPIFMEDDVFLWLKRFPRMIYLDLGEECELLQLEERGTLSPEVDSINSIRFLSVRTSPGLSYNFLRCLPSLQHLHLYVIQEPLVHDNSGNPGGLRMREEIMHADMLKSNVWELLPTLQTVTLLRDKCAGDECLLELQESCPFNRNQYECARRAGDLDDNELEPLRIDVQMYIHYKARGFDVY